MIVKSESFLRLPCEPVKDVQEGTAVARKLWSELDRYNKRAKSHSGVGLAANQIGIRKRVCVLWLNGSPLCLMNPTVVSVSRTKIPWKNEGCLSFPGVYLTTYRHVWVEVGTLNLGRLAFGPRSPENWNAQELFRSVAVQHEVGHLYGMLFQDFVSETGREWNCPLG